MASKLAKGLALLGGVAIITGLAYSVFVGKPDTAPLPLALS